AKPDNLKSMNASLRIRATDDSSMPPYPDNDIMPVPWSTLPRHFPHTLWSAQGLWVSL
ncbi:Ryanodine receptor 1, partial [Clarias magur]